MGYESGRQNFTTNDLANQRLGICSCCEYAGFENEEDCEWGIATCKKCNCIITEKVRYAEESCPVRKW